MAINDVLIVMEMDWLPEIERKVLLGLAHIKNPGKADEDHVRYASGVMANMKRAASASAAGSYEGRVI